MWTVDNDELRASSFRRFRLPQSGHSILKIKVVAKRDTREVFAMTCGSIDVMYNQSCLLV